MLHWTEQVPFQLTSTFWPAFGSSIRTSLYSSNTFIPDNIVCMAELLETARDSWNQFSAATILFLHQIDAFWCRQAYPASAVDRPDASETWRNLSPFSESNRFELSRFSLQQDEDLLRQYELQHQRNHGGGIMQEIPVLAAIIHQRTSGFPSLTGADLIKPLMQSCLDHVSCR